MRSNQDKIDEMVLALLFMTSFTEHGVTRAWKSHDWTAMNRLHEKGLIADPKSSAKSVALSKEGARRAEELFRRHFEVTG
jgi:hypothetical protein